MKIAGVLCFWFLRTVLAQSSSCDYFQRVAAGNTINIYSPNYPNSYGRGLQCRWILECPTGYNCRLNCPLIELPESQNCGVDRLLISRSGDPGLNGAETYCGRGSLTVVSTGQRLSLGLITGANTSGGRFMCKATTQLATSPVQCTCGQRRQNRIVGGEETGVNEFPMMVGLADRRILQIKCGGVIISENYVLTAAHCLHNLNVTSDVGLIIGEHDISTGTDTPVTKGYRVASYIIHPGFSQSTYDYDIAILKTTEPIQFSDRVGPVCLPFKYVNKSFDGDKVTLLGWGTKFFGGPTSKVLMKVDVNVISQNDCAPKVQRLTPRQICTFTQGKDSCQDDSGGPLLYTDPSTNLLFNIGIVSSGSACASNSPGINTRVPALLDWIVSNTRANYCMK